MSNFQRANELNMIGKWEQALPFAEHALADNRQWAPNWCLLAWTLNGLGRHGDALAATEEALRLSPDSEWAHRTRATALAQLGRRSEALKAAREAVGQAPNEWRAWTRLAETAHELGYPVDARSAAERAVRLAPQVAAVWLTLSYVTLQDDWEESAAAALRALGLEPECYVALNNLGYVRLLQGRYSEARDIFDRGIGIAPHYTKLVFNRALATVHLDGLEAGTVEFKRAEALLLSLAEQQLRADPTNATAHATRSRMLRMLRRDHVASLEAARRAVSLDPRSALAWSSLGVAAKSVGRWKLARYADRRAVQADPSAPIRWLQAAFTAQYAGLPDEARLWARRVVDEAPESNRVTYASALLAFLDGDPATARDLGLRDIELHGESCCHRIFIFNCCLELGDTDGAREALDLAEHRRPQCNCHARDRAERLLAVS